MLTPSKIVSAYVRLTRLMQEHPQLNHEPQSKAQFLDELVKQRGPRALLRQFHPPEDARTITPDNIVLTDKRSGSRWAALDETSRKRLVANGMSLIKHCDAPYSDSPTRVVACIVDAYPHLDWESLRLVAPDPRHIEPEALEIRPRGKQ